MPKICRFFSKSLLSNRIPEDFSRFFQKLSFAKQNVLIFCGSLQNLFYQIREIFRNFHKITKFKIKTFEICRIFVKIFLLQNKMPVILSVFFFLQNLIDQRKFLKSLIILSKTLLQNKMFEICRISFKIFFLPRKKPEIPRIFYKIPKSWKFVGFFQNLSVGFPFFHRKTDFPNKQISIVTTN